MAVLLTGGGVTPKTNSIVLTLEDLGDYGYVKINDTTYASGTYEIEVGTEIKVYMTGSYDDNTYVRVKQFGELVARALAGSYTYDTSLYSDVNITISVGYESAYDEYCIYIEETA